MTAGKTPDFLVLTKTVDFRQGYGADSCWTNLSTRAIPEMTDRLQGNRHARSHFTPHRNLHRMQSKDIGIAKIYVTKKERSAQV